MAVALLSVLGAAYLVVWTFSQPFDLSPKRERKKEEEAQSLPATFSTIKAQTNPRR